MISATVFKNLYSRETNTRISFEKFGEFEEMLYTLFKKPGYKPRKGEYPKFSSPMISPAVYAPNTNRANDNVIEWGGWAALDVDNYKPNIDSTGCSIQTDVFKNRDTKFVCYSTASSRHETPKYRLVFPLTRAVKNKEIPHFWYALNTKNNNQGDKQTKDLSRMYYVPAQYPNAFNFIFSNDSPNYLDVDALLKEYPYTELNKPGSFMNRLSPELQKEILANRIRKISNTNGTSSIEWTSYKDCPFVNKNLIDEYRSIAHIDGSGRYSMIYKIMASIAVIALRKGYPITEYELATLIQELDAETSNRYKKRPLTLEASRAIQFAYRNVLM